MLFRKNDVEKKRILADEYGMTMTAELERRIQIMCNWSESIRERERNDARIEARIEARNDARIEIIEKMIKANATKEQIISYGFTEAEYAEAENSVYANL